MTHTRKQLPVAQWPEGDRAAWEELFRDGDLLDGRGAAWHWSAATRLTNAKHYARWLGWLAAEGRLEGLAPWERASCEALEAYARALLAEVAPRTVASGLIGLKCVLQRMAPQEDWSWLKAMTNRLDRWAMPSRLSRAPEPTLPAMFDQALRELDQLSGIACLRPRELMAYRDTLIVALLIACPLRLRNLTMMEVGRHLSKHPSSTGGEWHLRFEPGETKTGQALHLLIPKALSGCIDEYLARIRSAFPGAMTHPRVWAAQKGRPMAYETIYSRVMLTTGRLFGTPINPHGFRGLAATWLAENSPEDALQARPLLGHRQMATTEKYYVRASQLGAAQNVSAALQAIRDAKRPTA